MAEADDPAASARRELSERIEAARQGGLPSGALLALARDAQAAGWAESAELLCTQGLDAEPGHEGLVALRRELQAAAPEEPPLTGWPLSPVGAMVFVGTAVCLIYVLEPDIESFKTTATTLLPVALITYLLGNRAAVEAELAGHLQRTRKLISLPYLAGFVVVMLLTLLEWLIARRTSLAIASAVGLGASLGLLASQLLAASRLGTIYRSPQADEHTRAAAACYLIAGLPGLLFCGVVAVELGARYL